MLWSLALRSRAGVAEVQHVSVPGLLLGCRNYGIGSHVSDNDPDIMEKARKRNLEGGFIRVTPCVV